MAQDSGQAGVQIPKMKEAINLVYCWEEDGSHQSELVERLWDLWKAELDESCEGASKPS